MTLVHLVSNRPSLALDRLLVRFTGISFITWVYMRAAGISYIPTLLLRTTGARTGRGRSAVLPYYRDGTRFLLVGSNGGAKVDPGWVCNLRANSHATIFVRRHALSVVAAIAAGAERERLWHSITGGRGPYAQYQAWARPRELPIVILTPS